MSKIGSKKVFETFLVVFAAFFVGLIAAISGLIPLRFVIAIMAGLLVFSVSFLFPDKKLYFLFLFAFLLPVHMNKAIYKIHSYYPYLREQLSLYLVDIILVVLYGIWFYRKMHQKDDRKIISFTFISIPFIFLILAAVVSLINAEMINRGLIEIWLMVRVFLIYFYIINNVTTGKEIKLVLMALVLGLIGQCGIVALQKYSHGTLGLLYLGESEEIYRSLAGQEVVHRPSALFEHPNLFSNYLEFMIPLSFGLSFLRNNKTLRKFATVAFFGGIAALILSLSRGGWIAVFLSLLGCSFFIFRKNLREHKFVIKSVVTILIGVFFIAGFWPQIINRITSHDAGAAKTRILQFDVAKEVVMSHPLIGVGINNYIVVMEKYDETASMVSRYFKLPIHNAYLLILGETGIFGFSFFMWLVFIILIKGFINIRKSRGFLFYLNTGLIFGFTGYFMHAFVDMNFISRLPEFMFMAGLFTITDYAINGRINLQDE